MKNIALYIHIPFCNSKCDYCDFYSCVCSQQTKNEFSLALLKEIEKHKNLLKSRNVKSIYIGGGTPSVMVPSFFVKLKKNLNEFCNYDKNLEFTVEANPNSFNEKLAKTLKSIGVNRISLGLQSTKDNILKSVHRLQNLNDFKNSIKIVKNHFSNFSVDLMIGLPNQTLKDVKSSLKAVLKFKPKHLSVYNLIIEEKTPISQNSELLALIPKEEKQLKMNNLVLKTLCHKGFNRYEVSNYAKKCKNEEDKYISKHNQTYWLGGDYLGLGPSAHSFVDGYRFFNDRNLADYIANKTKIIKEKINQIESREEQIMLGLRTKWGCLASICNQQELNELVKARFVKIRNDRVVVLSKGMNVLNLIISKLI